MGFLILLASSFLLCIPAWYVARKRRSWFAWDYATVFAPMPIWLVLAVIQVGAKSMSNLVELLVIAAAVPLAVSVRVFWLDGKWNDPTRNSLGVLFFLRGCLAAGVETRDAGVIRVVDNKKPRPLVGASLFPLPPRLNQLNILLEELIHELVQRRALRLGSLGEIIEHRGIEMHRRDQLQIRPIKLPALALGKIVL